MRSGYRFFQAAPLICITLLGAAVIWYGKLEPPVLRYVNLPFPVETVQVYPGDVVLFRVERCITESVEHTYWTTRALVNVETQEVIHLEARPATLRPGCTNDRSGLTAVPAATKPGRYFLQGVTAAQGTIRVRYVPWRTAAFDVVERPGPP